MRHLLEQEALTDRVEVDSAGTAAYHAGEPPDRRATRAALARGIRLGGLARAFRASDWDEFDYVLAMDAENFDDLAAAAPNVHRSKLHLLREFDPDSADDAGVPDPYYGGAAGFEHVIDLCEAACRGLIRHLRERGEI